MNKFIIEKNNKVYNVTWPGFLNVKQVTSKHKLLGILFDKVKCESAGLIINLYQEDCDTLWVNYETYYMDTNGAYSDFIEDMYSITGISFKKLVEAKKFVDELEKLYIWKALKI